MSSNKGILQKSCSSPCQSHATKLKWDENKLKEMEMLKEQVTMKVDEPKTPFVRYNADIDEVTNWQDLPEHLRLVHKEPEEFSLGGGQSVENFSPGTDAWDEEEEQEKQEQARKRHEEFERKRAQHYGHTAEAVFDNDKGQ